MAAAGNRRHDINSMKNKNADGEPLSIGRFIKQKVDERHISYAEFARLIHCGRTSIYHIFEARSIDVDRLLLISRVLDFDFFAEYYNHRPHASAAAASAHNGALPPQPGTTTASSISSSFSSSCAATASVPLPQPPSALSPELVPAFLPAPCLVLPMTDGLFDFSSLPPEVLAALRRELPSE